MKKNILIGLAILAVSTSAAVAAKKHKAAAPAAATASASPMMMGQVSAADKAMYKKNQHDSGMKK
jgi:hypothetical protein